MYTIIYHANCPDGFLAAFTCWLQFGEENVNYIPASYGQALDIPDATTVYIVDFSLPPDQLKDLARRSKSVIVLDHHKTAQEALTPLIDQIDHLHVIFDMEKCGSMLTWEYFHPTEPAPYIYYYVQDRDLWQWKLPQSREVSAGLSLIPKEFQNYNNMLSNDSIISNLAEMGEIILRVHQKQIKKLAKNAYDDLIAGHATKIVNSPILQSELCEHLLAENPYLHFVACYYYREDRKIWSLRSVGDFDVSTIAKLFGGGGHRNAAGFTEVANPKSNHS